MKFIKIWLIIAIYTSLSYSLCHASGSDSARLFLSVKAPKEHAAKITAILMAHNDALFNLAAIQGTVRTAAWLQLTALEALKPDSSIDGNKMALTGNSFTNNDKRSTPITIVSMGSVASRQGYLPVARLTFTVEQNKILNQGDSVVFIIDSLKASTSEARLLKTPLSIFLVVIVGDTTGNSNNGDDDTTKTDSRYRLKFSLKKDTPHEGFVLQEGKLKLAVNLDYRAIISQLQFSLILPDTGWTIVSATPTDNEKRIFFNKVGTNKYKLMLMGDAPDHPLLPDLQNPDRKILEIILRPTVTPFGQKIFRLEEISAGSTYEDEPLIANTNSALSTNLNQLFGTVIGKKGDLQFAEWLFGDGQLNTDDEDLMVQIIMEILSPNAYQQWAADINNDGVINALDLTELQKLIKLSGVYLNAAENYQILIQDKHLTLLSDSWNELTLDFFSLTGQVLRTATIRRHETIFLPFNAGFYLYAGRLKNADDEQFVRGKILIE